MSARFRWLPLTVLCVAAISAAPAAPIVSGVGTAQTLAQLEAGRRALAAGNAAEALGHFDKALTGDPKSVGAALGRAESLSRLQRWTEVEATLQRAQAAEPRNAEIRTAIGRVAFARGQHERALQEFQAALDYDPDFVPAMLDLGETALLVGRADYAERAFRSAATIEPTRAGAHFGLGRALLRRGQSAEAIAAFERAAELEPQRAQPWLAIANVHASAKKWDEAAAALARARKADSQDRSVALALGDLDVAAGRTADAVKEYGAAAAKFSDWPEPLIRKGRIHQQLGERAAAESAYRDAIKRGESQSAVALNNLAWMLAEDKRNLDEAAALARRATELNPNEPSFYGTLARVYDARGDAKAATVATQKAEQLRKRR